MSPKAPACVRGGGHIRLAAPYLRQQPAAHGHLQRRRLLPQLLEQAKARKISSASHLPAALRGVQQLHARHSKRMTLNFLYELLHREGDVRCRAARLMGRILANSGPSYRKGASCRCARHRLRPPPSWAILPRRSDCGTREIQLCLHPGRKNFPKHAQRIADNLKVITESLFSVCSDYDAQIMARPLLRRLPEAQEGGAGGPSNT